MLLSFEVCEVCCDYQSHANPRDSPGHLFPGTSVHRLGLYSGLAQLPGSGLSILILRGPQDGEEAIFRDCSWTISDLLMQTFGSRMNIILYISGWTSTKFGIWWEYIWITGSFITVLFHSKKKKNTFHNVSDFAPLSSDKEFLKEFLNPWSYTYHLCIKYLNAFKQETINGKLERK